jgi:hypothetical protein
VRAALAAGKLSGCGCARVQQTNPTDEAERRRYLQQRVGLDGQMLAKAGCGSARCRAVRVLLG